MKITLEMEIKVKEVTMERQETSGPDERQYKLGTISQFFYLRENFSSLIKSHFEVALKCNRT
jgi:hypothetical protein